MSEEEKSKKLCKKDNDCNKNEYCAFNENDNNHYCISNNIYLGCLKNNDDMYRFITSNDEKNSKNIDNCINFARKLNDNEIIYDYIQYRPKIETPIKKNSINVDLNCGNMKILNLPYEDSFNEDCDLANENCTIKPKDNVLNIIKSNMANCKNDYHLNVNYKCDVENVDKHIKVNLNENSIKNLEFKLSCPINTKNNPYEAKCTPFSLNDENNIQLSNVFDNKIIQQKCKNPVYLLPSIINDINDYKLKKSKALEKNMENFEHIISADQEELNKKRALQYMVSYEKKFGTKISYEEALNHVKNTIEHATNASSSFSELWDITSGLNKVPFLNTSDNYSSYDLIGGTISSSGSAKTFSSIDEVLTSVQDNYSSNTYPDYIVYFYNTSTNDPNAGKAYAISASQLDAKGKLLSSTWYDNLANNGGSAITIINKSATSQNNNAQYLDAFISSQYENIEEELDYSLKRLEEYQKNEEKAIEDKNNEIEKQINYMNQRIKNSNYQSDMNKKIIKYLYILLIFIFIITVSYFVYMSQMGKNTSLTTM